MELRTGFLRQVLDKKSRSDRPYVCFLLEEESGPTWINLFDVEYMGGRVGAESEFDIHEWKGEKLQVSVEPSDDGKYLQCVKIVPVGMIEHLRSGGRPFQEARSEVERGAPDETRGIAVATEGASGSLDTAQEPAVDHVLLRVMEKAGAKAWVKEGDLLGQVRRQTGLVVGLEDMVASARRVWQQLHDQESRTSIEYDKEHRRCRLLRVPKAKAKHEGGGLWD